MGRVKARAEGAAAPVQREKHATADPVPGDNGAALERIVAYFRASHPEDWEMLRLCPLQHGLVDMIEKLKG